MILIIVQCSLEICFIQICSGRPRRTASTSPILRNAAPNRAFYVPASCSIRSSHRDTPDEFRSRVTQDMIFLIFLCAPSYEERHLLSPGGVSRVYCNEPFHQGGTRQTSPYRSTNASPAHQPEFRHPRKTGTAHQVRRLLASAHLPRGTGCILHTQEYRP